MSRKILKVLISLLFLAVAAVAALLGIKNFMPELFDTPKYGVKKPAEITPARKTPAFKKDNQNQEKNGEEPARPVYRQIPEDMTDKYGVAPLNQVGLERVTVDSKYGVAPVRDDRMMLKYGVAPVRRSKSVSNKDLAIAVPIRSKSDIHKLDRNWEEAAKYGVEPIEDVGPFVDDLENSEDIGKN